MDCLIETIMNNYLIVDRRYANINAIKKDVKKVIMAFVENKTVGNARICAFKCSCFLSGNVNKGLHNPYNNLQTWLKDCTLEKLIKTYKEKYLS